jgi:Zn-finger nucleic acid-binding protein
MVFVGAKFCSHCGAMAKRMESSEAIKEHCPRCRVSMSVVVIGGTNLKECGRCQGIWADSASLEQVCADRERQAAVLGMAKPIDEADAGSVEIEVKYVRCPTCNKFMNRVNFAHCSRVVVDVCREHGTWFDTDELRRIVEFIRGGGLEAARSRQISELESQRKRLQAQRTANTWSSREMNNPASDYVDWAIGISDAASFLTALLRK